MGLRKQFGKWCIAICLVLLPFLVGGMWGIVNGDLAIPARSNPERIAFLEQNGWEVEETPVIPGNVRIPSVFDDVYEGYNKIQMEQGFDLKKYAGKEVERYQYVVTNYPNYSGKVRANLLVFDGKIIGGDICSIELDGFMHGILQKS